MGELFGTDGVRGRAGEGDLSEPRVSALGRALGTVLVRDLGADTRSPRALLGNDGRASAEWIEAALARGLAASGVTATSAGLIPTPGLATCTREGPFVAGLMVSASHNPAEDNGIKVFDERGAKLDDALEDAVERELARAPEPVEAGPRPAPDPSLSERYLEHLLAHAAGLSLDGLELVVDCANGAASRVGPVLLERLGATVRAIASRPDGTNINAGCGSTHMELLQRTVRETGAALGLALDGDGDRCLFADQRGELVDGDATLAVLARRCAETGELPGNAVVATVMSNKGLAKSLSEVGVGLVTCGVGDRRVVEAMRQHGLALGGEQSGHVVFGERTHFVGDGLYTALRVLETLRAHGGPASELFGVFHAFPQVLENVRVRSKPALDSIPELSGAIAAVEAELGDDGRVLVRYSGTENLARVMVEGPDERQIARATRRIAEVFERHLGA